MPEERLSDLAMLSIENDMVERGQSCCDHGIFSHITTDCVGPTVIYVQIFNCNYTYMHTCTHIHNTYAYTHICIHMIYNIYVHDCIFTPWCRAYLTQLLTVKGNHRFPATGGSRQQFYSPSELSQCSKCDEDEVSKCWQLSAYTLDFPFTKMK